MARWQETHCFGSVEADHGDEEGDDPRRKPLHIDLKAWKQTLLKASLNGMIFQTSSDTS